MLRCAISPPFGIDTSQAGGQPGGTTAASSQGLLDQLIAGMEACLARRCGDRMPCTRIDELSIPVHRVAPDRQRRMR